MLEMFVDTTRLTTRFSRAKNILHSCALFSNSEEKNLHHFVVAEFGIVDV